MHICVLYIHAVYYISLFFNLCIVCVSVWICVCECEAGCECLTTSMCWSENNMRWPSQLSSLFDTTYFIVHHYIPGWWGLGSLLSKLPSHRRSTGVTEAHTSGFYMDFWHLSKNLYVYAWFIFIVFKWYVCVYVCMRAHVHMCTHVEGSQKRAWDSLELEC